MSGPAKSLKRKNKTKGILKYYAAHSGAKPSNIAEALSKRGFDITADYVSTILSNHRKRDATGKRTAPAGKLRGKRASSIMGESSGISADELMLAKQLVGQSGSVAAARQALELYDDIVS